MNQEKNNLLVLKDTDSLPCLTEGVQDYTLVRYKIYRITFSIWTTWWKDKARWIGYLDLTAGPGYSQTEKLKKIKKQVGASPIIALETVPSFTNFIFIEKNPEYFAPLKKRVGRSKNCRVINKDANSVIDSALLEIQGHCLVCIDPFRPSDITWRTVSKILQEKFCDIVGVLPAPLIQRSVGRFSDRSYIKSLCEHMPPSFSLKKAKELGEKCLKYCMKTYAQFIQEEFDRFVFTYYIKDARYQVLFAFICNSRKGSWEENKK